MYHVVIHNFERLYSFNRYYKILAIFPILLGFHGGSDSKESTFIAGDLGLIPGLGRFPGGGHGNPLQYKFKGYTPFMVMIKYWLYSPSYTIQYTTVAYFIPNSFHLLLPCPYVPSPPSLLPSGNQSWFSISVEFASFLLYS